MKRYVLVVRDEVQDETEAITAWYEDKRAGLGERFVNALESTYKQIRSNPFYQVRKSLYRYALIEGFPHYRIVYAVDQETITVYEVRHTSREPHPEFGP